MSGAQNFSSRHDSLTDWSCLSCHRSQLRRRPICRDCGAIRPRHMRPDSRENSWFCNKCERERPSTSNRCTHCQLDRSPPPPPRAPPVRTASRKTEYEVTRRGRMMRINYTDSAAPTLLPRCLVCGVNKPTATLYHDAERSHTCVCEECGTMLALYDQPCPSCQKEFEELILPLRTVQQAKD